MSEGLDQLLDAAIMLEMNVAELYMLFNKAFQEDADFWRQLAVEEKNHAALLRSIKEFFLPLEILPSGLFSETIPELKNSQAKISTLIERYKESSPSRKETFIAAIELEQLAGEIHFQKYMSEESASRIDDMFKELNQADKDHAERIRSYMEVHHIGLCQQLDK